MHNIQRIAVLGVTLMSSAVAIAETPADIFREIDNRKRASLADVSDYTQMKSIMGICTVEYFEKESVQSTDGRGNIDYMRALSIIEISERNSTSNALSEATPGQLDSAAGTMRAMGPQVEAAYREQLASVNLPGGLSTILMNPPSDEPWLSPNPGDTMNNYATMLEAAAEGKRQDAARKDLAKADAGRDRLAEVAALTRIAGRETINGREANLLIADGLDYRQVTDGQEFIMNTLRLWVDTETYVPLKMSVSGVARDGNESRDLVIEREDSDFRTLAGCGSLREPHRSVMRVAGILNAEQQAEMAEAQQKMAEFEVQMASMPPSQKDMIMRQMGPQLEMFRNMMSGDGGMEVVSEITAMRCNSGTPSNDVMLQTVPGMNEGCSNSFPTGSTPGSSGPPPDSSSGGGGAGSGSSGGSAGGGSSDNTGLEIDTDLIKRIQRDLKTLGYYPGSIDGILSRPTVVAITKFEAANGMEVTGQATPQLAGILAAKVDAMN